MKRMLILQHFGLGDCIFAQGVAKKFTDEGYEIIWPVRSQFLLGLQRAYPDILWVPDSIVRPELFDIKDDREVEGIKIMPIRWADVITGRPAKYWMRSKFDYVGLNYEYWKKDAMFSRNHLREIKLYHDVYDLGRNERYNLISKEFTSDASKSIDIKVDNGLRNVVMGFHEGYSLFDHAFLIEHAETIHATNSAIFYLLELLSLRAHEIHMYERTPQEKGFPYVDYLMTKNYILHDTKKV